MLLRLAQGEHLAHTCSLLPLNLLKHTHCFCTEAFFQRLLGVADWIAEAQIRMPDIKPVLSISVGSVLTCLAGTFHILANASWLL